MQGDRKRDEPPHTAASVTLLVLLCLPCPEMPVTPICLIRYPPKKAQPTVPFLPRYLDQGSMHAHTPHRDQAKQRDQDRGKARILQPAAATAAPLFITFCYCVFPGRTFYSGSHVTEKGRGGGHSCTAPCRGSANASILILSASI